MYNQAFDFWRQNYFQSNRRAGLSSLYFLWGLWCRWANWMRLDPSHSVTQHRQSRVRLCFATRRGWTIDPKCARQRASGWGKGKLITELSIIGSRGLNHPSIYVSLLPLLISQANFFFCFALCYHFIYPYMFFLLWRGREGSGNDAAVNYSHYNCCCCCHNSFPVCFFHHLSGWI